MKISKTNSDFNAVSAVEHRAIAGCDSTRNMPTE